jgi:hypothetical protein
MASQTPLVLEGISLLDFVQYILKTHAEPSTIIICSTNESFLQQLHDALTSNTHADHDSGNTPQQQLWTTPTLRLLASSRTVKLAFCPELAHLRAYLAAYAHRTWMELDDSVSTSTSRRLTRTLAILNPIALHRPTSAFSAQGFNRTLAVAVEAAYHTRSRLVLAEIPSTRPAGVYGDLYDSPDSVLEGELHDAAAGELASNPWDDEVSILNVTTKSFGAGERGWVGRTVKVRAVVGRWCVFQDARLDAG